MSDGRYERTICSGINANAGLDKAGATYGTYGVARQTGPALGHSGSA